MGFFVGRSIAIGLLLCGGMGPVAAQDARAPANADAPLVRVAGAEQGRAQARALCSECHAVERGRLTSPNAEAPAFEAIANTPGMHRTALIVFFNTPHRMMPNLVLGRAEADDIIDYILSLKAP